MEEMIAREAALKTWGPKTGLFKRYQDYSANRIDRVTHQPIPEPITELREALVLLYEHGRLLRRIRLDGYLPDGTFGPVLEILDFDDSAQVAFPIAPELVETLKAANVLSGGCSRGRAYESELRLNERATDLIYEEIRKYDEAHPEEKGPL